MAQGFKLIYDPDVTVFRRVKITTPTAGTAVPSGTPVDTYRTGSSTVEVCVGTTAGGQGALLAASLTSSLYGVTVETIYAGQTSVLIAVITNRQIWSCEASTSSTTLAAPVAATLLTYENLRSIPGYFTYTHTTPFTNSPGSGDLRYLDTTGVKDIPAATTMAVATTVVTGLDVGGPTGVFVLMGTLPAVSTTRVVGRFLVGVLTA